jgi:16S rRNA (guanine527-N7)-methyltransferase
LPDLANGFPFEQLENCLIQGLSKLGQSSTKQQINQLISFLELLHRWNTAFNITAIREPRAMLARHVFDSLAIKEYIVGNRLIDVGTGAGLPGIPLAITCPKKNFVLLDSNSKKTGFLFQARTTLKLANVQEVNERAEKHIPTQKYDAVLCRAYGSLSELVLYTNHLLVPGGKFFAMKGKISKEELRQLPKNYSVENIYKLAVPELDEERHLIIVK